MDAAVQASLQNGWKTSTIKTKRVRIAIKAVLEQAFNAAQAGEAPGAKEGGDSYTLEAEATRILELVKHQNDY